MARTLRRRVVAGPQKVMRWDEVLARLPEGSCTIAEIGVWQGKLSRAVLAGHPAVRMTLVDPWVTGAPGTTWKHSGSDMAADPQRTYDRAFSDVQALSRRYSGRVTIWRATSLEAAAQIEELFDLVFIDGEHTERAVAEDIDAWAPKVKVGGYIGGHDYHSKRFPGVARAVEAAFSLDAIERGENSTWFVRL